MLFIRSLSISEIVAGTFLLPWQALPTAGFSIGDEQGNWWSCSYYRCAVFIICFEISNLAWHVVTCRKVFRISSQFIGVASFFETTPLGQERKMETRS